MGASARAFQEVRETEHFDSYMFNNWTLSAKAYNGKKADYLDAYWSEEVEDAPPPSVSALTVYSSPFSWQVILAAPQGELQKLISSDEKRIREDIKRLKKRREYKTFKSLKGYDFYLQHPDSSRELI